MDRQQLLTRLLLLKRNPALYKDLSNQELAEFVLVVLSQVDTIDKAIKEGRLDGKTPQAGKDYLSKKQCEDMLTAMYKQAVDNLATKTSAEYTKLEKSIQARLDNLRDGKDGQDALVTDELVREIAEIASDFITLPDFETLITQEPGAIRDALELLQGDDRLDKSAIKGLDEWDADIRKDISRAAAGGVSRNTVAQMIADAPAGSGDMLAATYDPQNIAGDAFDTDNHTDGTTNHVFTALDDTKLAGIEALADVTDATNVAAAGAVMEADTSTASMQFVIDEDSMATNSATKVPTQQSVKAYVDASVAAGVADGDKGDITVSGSGATWTIDADAVTYAKIQNVVADNVLLGNNAGAGGVVDELTATEVRTILNVEDGADVTDTTNVTAAGALMDSEVTNLAAVKAFDPADYAAALGVDDNYVTDAEKTVIGNTSGTNTGDQTSIVGITGTKAEFNTAVTDGDIAFLNGANAFTVGGQTITVADTTNVAGLTINQNDATNDPLALEVNGKGSGAKVTSSTLVQYNDTDGSNSDWSFNVAGDGYPVLNLQSTGGTLGAPTATLAGVKGVVDYYVYNSTPAQTNVAQIQMDLNDGTAASEDSSLLLNTMAAGTLATRLEVGAEAGATLNGISVGATTAAGVLSSRGSQDLVLQTGNATTGTITITDGANGAINLAPNGSGEVQANGERIIDETDTASDTVAGIVELATTAETNTGTDTARAVTPDGLAGSYAGTKSLSVQVFDGTTDVTTGDGKAYITIPESLNGMNLIRAQATVVTAGTTNATTVMIHNKTDAADMLSGAISIASAGTVGTVGTINGASDDVATNDVLRIDVDSVSTTAPKGLMVVLEFRLP